MAGPVSAAKWITNLGRARSATALRAGNRGGPGKSLSSQRFGLYGQSPALIVIEAHSPATELFSKHPILLAKIFNDLQLAVVHPPGDGDQQKTEWAEHSLRIQNPLSRPPSHSSEPSDLHADSVFGPGSLRLCHHTSIIAHRQTVTDGVFVHVQTLLTQAIIDTGSC
jgi:hypothetical protein